VDLKVGWIMETQKAKRPLKWSEVRENQILAKSHIAHVKVIVEFIY